MTPTRAIARTIKTKKMVYATLCTLSVLLYFAIQAIASGSLPLKSASYSNAADTSIAATLRAQLKANEAGLYFPRSVERFYQQNGFKLAWVAPDTIKTHASEGMLLLDCVLQYGLNRNDYHPRALSYDELRAITAKGSSVSDAEKSRFDMMLTDAMLNFANNLHYGKVNPDYPAERIDEGADGSFNAEAVLKDALGQNNFMQVIERAQPQTKEYANMKDRMRQLMGVYQEDCYEVPQKDIVRMAINLERLRWINSDDKTYIEINIPAYTLMFYQPDTVYRFKVIVGKPTNPTPALQSAISYFNIAPDWKVPQSIFIKEILPKSLKDPTFLEGGRFAIYDHKGHYIRPTKANLATVRQNPMKYLVRQSPGCDNALGLISFRFPNLYDVYLHDTPEQSLFAKEARDLSHGCIRVEHAKELAALLLKNDGVAEMIPAMQHAMDTYQAKIFTLRKAIPIKVTYLTCEVKEGLLITYPDIYSLDKSLELALYNTAQPLTAR